jgi:arsenate reductase
MCRAIALPTTRRDHASEKAGDTRSRRLYLETPPNTVELRAIVTKLAIEPEQLVRKGEDVYKSKYAGKALSEAQWIQAMVE